MWSTRRKELSMQVCKNILLKWRRLFYTLTQQQQDQTSATCSELEPSAGEHKLRGGNKADEELHATSCFTSAQGDPGPEALISEHRGGRFSERLV